MNKPTVKPIMGEPFDVTKIEEEIAGLIDETSQPRPHWGPQISIVDKPPEELTQDRRQTHGNFRDNARLSQMLKSVMRATASWDHLDDVEKESLDMIALKISRVLSGKSLERQHWEDIEGYAHLALKECDA